MEKTVIDIGTKIDLANLIQSRLLIQANSGGGKTVICRVLIEESHGKVPFIIIDDAGEYYPLKEKFGDIVIIGGQFADVPISMQAVKLLPKFIFSNQLNVIIDISDLKSSQREQYLRQFLDTLVDLPQQYWKPYLILIEEAHKYCGEQDRQLSAKPIKELMSGGRKKGFCGVLITQRIAKLHKDAAAECNNKFIGRTSLDIDMDRVAKELGFTASSEFTRLSLRDLQPGHFYAYGTSIEPHHVHEVIIKMPETKIVKAGSIVEIKPKKPTQQLLSSLTKLNDLPQDAAKELKTVQDLQKEVSRLTGELKKVNRGTDKPSESQQKAIEALRHSVSDLQNRLKQKELESSTLQKVIDGYNKSFEALETLVLKYRKTPAQTASAINTFLLPKFPKLDLKKDIPTDGRIIMGPNYSKENGSLGKCSREIIRFLAQYPDRQFSKAQVAIATGYSPVSGGFNNSLSELNQKGFIVRFGKLQVNAEAMEEVIKCVGPITQQEYSISTYSDKLAKCEREIYVVLLASPETEFTKQELSQSTETPYSPDSGGFNNSLSRLNMLELIKRRNGKIILNPELLELMQ